MPTAEYMRQYRQERRRRAVELLGSKCSRCGSTDRLEIDHVDPEKKTFPLSGFHKSWAAILEELTKCQLLCQSCHQDKTSAENSAANTAGCGTPAQYKRGCRCTACITEMKAARRRWNMRYRGRP